MTAMDDDSDRATTAINAAEMRALLTKARTERNEQPAAPRATEAVAPIVIIVDRPVTVIGGLIKSARSAGQRLVTLSKFRALRNEVRSAPAEMPTGPIAKTLAAAAADEPMQTQVTLGPPVTLYEARGGAAVVASEALTITSSEQSATLHARPMISIVGFPKMRLPTELPEPPPEQPPEPVRAFPVGTRPIQRRVASGVAITRRPLLDGYALAAILFIAGAVMWMLVAR
jgi:hypothetical protein